MLMNVISWVVFVLVVFTVYKLALDKLISII